MRYLEVVFFSILVLVLSSGTSHAQLKNDTLQSGKVHGVVRDSVHNYVLDLASVAIYKEKDSVLVSYQLTNSFGEFQFEKVPVGVSLRIIVSYVGYKTFMKQFNISVKDRFMDLKELIMYKKTMELKEVVVKYIPPVRMNQDTLEFNADAFQLDKNAVVEDLLRKLPRLTIWGDGTITMNGKPVRQVLVNGKPFFGGDFRVALQNIPKDAVDKIQVYKEQQNRQNPLDSITSVNIKLKKDKSSGLFGKLLLGYGVNKRYEGDANVNFFNNRTQFSVVAAANNVNKLANNANILLRNSTYKSTGASIEYQPDLRLLGINQSAAGGIVVRHDFISDANYNNTSFLKADYFNKNNNNTTSINSKIVTTIKADSTQIQDLKNQNRNENSNQTLNVEYVRRKKYFKLNADITFNETDNTSESSSQINLYGQSQDLKSTNNLDNTTNIRAKNLALNLDLNREKGFEKMNNLPGSWSIGYSLNLGESIADGANGAIFTSVSDQSQNQKINRIHHKISNDAAQRLSLGLGNFSGLLFPKTGFFGIGLSFRNDVDLSSHSENSLVRDLDASGEYKVNSYLTNLSKLTIFNEKPALVLTKSFSKKLADRFMKVVFIDVVLQEQFYYQTNSSIQTYQNFKRSYQKFVPGASINFRNDQYGDFIEDFTLSFSTFVNYPTVNQLRPLVDSTNLYDIALGNPNLREEKEHSLSFKLDHSSQKTKNTFGYNAEFRVGMIRNPLVDSIITDTIGRRSHYTTNANESKYMSISGALNKTLKFNQHQLQLKFLPSLSFYHNPFYTNNFFIISNTISSYNSLSLLYSFNDWLAVSLTESFQFYNSKQRGANDLNFRNSTTSTIFGTAVNFTKRMSLGSNVSYNSAKSTASNDFRYTIWNANAAYRMLKGNKLELKLAALDLLRQNTGIINTGFNNTITRGTSNVLKQYFMISLAYYPRQFGFNEKQKIKVNE
jgi:hypothetical protein